MDEATDAERLKAMRTSMFRIFRKQPGEYAIDHGWVRVFNGLDRQDLESMRDQILSLLDDAAKGGA